MTWITVRAAVFVLLASLLHGSTVESGEPAIVAHRGLLRYAPENTLANFRACLNLRIGFEFDVEQTRDGHLVCIHDDTVDRTTDGTGRVAELTLDEIQACSAGRWFSAEFAEERVPTVEQVLQLIASYRQVDVLIAVDLKAAGVGAEVVRLAEKHKVLHRLLFIGRTIAEPQLRRQLRLASKAAHTAAVANTVEEFSEALSAPNADWVYVRYLPDAQQMEAVHRAHKRAFIAGSTVSGNVPVHWKHVLDVGVDAILTDYPLQLRTTFRDTPHSR